MPNKFIKIYSRSLAYYSGSVWAITPEKLAEIQAFIARKAASLEAHDESNVSAGHYAAAKKPSATSAGDVMVLPMFGTISKRMDMMSEMSGGVSVENFTRDFRAAVDNPAIKAIVMNIDSPGGTVSGVPELADEIRAARDKKYIVALANDMAASGAYWLASAASEFVMTPSAAVGSIGVYTMHMDYTEAMQQDGVKATIIRAGKNKIAANPYESLSEEALATIQQSVDYYYGMFIDAVAAGRDVSTATVKKDFGQGKMFNAKDAKANNMVDRVDTLDGVLTRLGAKPTGGSIASPGRRAHLAHAMLDIAEVE